MRCQDKNCQHGHCPVCGNCDLVDNNGDGFENDSNPFFCTSLELQESAHHLGYIFLLNLDGGEPQHNQAL